MSLLLKTLSQKPRSNREGRMKLTHYLTPTQVHSHASLSPRPTHAQFPAQNHMNSELTLFFFFSRFPVKYIVFVQLYSREACKKMQTRSRSAMMVMSIRISYNPCCRWHRKRPASPSVTLHCP